MACVVCGEMVKLRPCPHRKARRKMSRLSWLESIPGHALNDGCPSDPPASGEQLKPGDLVEAVRLGHPLCCGSGRYQFAVVVSTAPFALVSESGDMLWTCTHSPETVRKVGVCADPEKAFARWEREKKNYGG